VNIQTRQQPIADERADHSDDQIPDETKAAASYNLTRQPAGDDANHDYDKETLVRQAHGARSFNAANLGDVSPEAQRLKQTAASAISIGAVVA
jgi:hypothetical protein